MCARVVAIEQEKDSVEPLEALDVHSRRDIRVPGGHHGHVGEHVLDERGAGGG